MTVVGTQSTVDLILGEEDNLRRIARLVANCDPDADDLVQETLMRAYVARDRLTPGTSVRAWTSTILRRVFLTRAIRDGRRAVRTDADNRLAAVLDHRGPESWDRLDDLSAVCEDFDDEVKRALDRIPSNHRQAFHLAVLRGMTCKEISSAFSVPKGTVMSRIHRARERLRIYLAHYPGRPGARAASADRLRRKRPAALRRDAPRTAGGFDAA